MKRVLLVLLAMGMLLMPLTQVFADPVVSNLNESFDGFNTPSPSPKPSPTPVPPYGYAIIVTPKGKTTAPVQDYYQKGKPVIGSVPEGEKVVLVTFSPDGRFYRIAYDNGERAGWILTKYLKYVRE